MSTQAEISGQAYPQLVPDMSDRELSDWLGRSLLDNKENLLWPLRWDLLLSAIGRYAGERCADNRLPARVALDRCLGRFIGPRSLFQDRLETEERALGCSDKRRNLSRDPRAALAEEEH